MKAIPAVLWGTLCLVALERIPAAQAYDARDTTFERTVEESIGRYESRESRPGLFRIEGGLGYSNGGTDTTLSSPGIGSVSTDLLGGGGLTAEASLWIDHLLALRDISLGAQYLYFDGSGSVTATSSAGSVLGLTSATGTLGLTTNAMMFNAAWRPDFGRVHPLLGAGVGVAFAELSGSALGLSISNSQTSLAGQVFLGFDYDLTEDIYAGVSGRFFISDATYQFPGASIQVTNRPISLLAHVGMRF